MKAVAVNVAAVPRSLTPTDQELVTVVIPARNEESFIGPCLDSVLAQTHTNLQVIVVDGNSTDRTVDIVRDYIARDPRVELLSNPNAIVPSALNIALAATRSDWLVRIDAHATIPPKYVERAYQHLKSGRWGGVGGRKDGVGVTSAGRAIAAAMGSRFGVGNSTYHYGTDLETVEHIPFGAYPTQLARALNGWDEKLRVNQDFEFDYRVRMSGKDLLFDPELVINWYCRQSLPDFFRQYRRYGKGKAKVARLHPDSVRARHLAAPGLVVSWLIALLLLPKRPKWSAVIVSPYLASLAAASAVTVRKTDGWRAKLLVPGAFLAMHTGWGLGFFGGLWSTIQRQPTD